MRLIRIVLVCVTLVSTVKGEEWTGDYFEVEESKEVVQLSHSDKSWTIQIQENVGKGKVVGKFLYDGDPTGFTIYGPKIFEVNDEMQLVTRTDIDYESTDKIIVTIVRKETVLEFIFMVDNLNDNPIYLTKSTNDACIHPENRKGPTSCIYIVSDEDGISNQIEFSYKSNRLTIPIAMSNPNAVVKTSEVTLTFIEEVDFEKENSIVVDWTAMDEMGEKFSATLKVIVSIQDEPDEPPIWKKVLGSATIEEEKEMEFEVLAQDGDVGINSKIAYSLKSIKPDVVKDKIKINQDTGVLSIGKVDRDLNDINSIDIVIIAKETDDPWDEINQTATILVEDINDNKPEITLSTSSRSINENFNEILTTLDIDDLDINDNGRYDVTLDVDVAVLKGVFQIIPLRGYQKTSFSLSVIDSSKLDYDMTEELRKPFQITIKATDKDDIATQEIFTINLININDEIPTFTESEYSIEIPETFGRKESKTLPTKENFYAIDNDYGDTVTYRLTGKAIQLIMELDNEKPGDKQPIIIKTKAPKHQGVQIFDYELQEEVVVTIEAQDNFPDAPVPHKVLTQLTIKITDVNDEVPSIRTANGSTKYSILENREDISDENIFIVASDPDSKPKLKFGIDWESSYAMKNKERIKDDDFNKFIGCFSLKPLNRFDAEEDKVQLMINSKKSVDFEIFDTLYLEVIVEDENTDADYKGIKDKAGMTIVIDVQNDNDCPPVFDESTFKDVKIKEHADAGDIISYIKATDDDHEPLTYELYKTDGQTSNLVKIKEDDGMLSVAEAKKIDADNQLSEYLDFNVIVYDADKKHNDQKELKIFIIDINDNPPVIGDQPIMEVKENSETSDEWTIPVTDSDRDATHRMVSCAIIGKEERKFTARPSESNNEECVVFLDLKDGNEIDREDIEIYTVKLMVRDYPEAMNPAERLSDTKDLKIIILDENDNAPIINYSKTSITSITENTAINEVIGTIVGTDPDKDENGRISYFLTDIQLIENNESQDDVKQLGTDFFELNASTGKLKLLKSLQGFYGDYNLVITLKDNGKSPLSTPDQLVKLHIEKYNFRSVEFGKYESKLLLAKDQQPNQNLKLYGDQKLDPIKATDGQRDKYSIVFDITEQMINGEKVDYFKLQSASPQSTHLQLKTIPKDLDATYTVKVSANAMDAHPSRDPAYLELTIQFFDLNTDPTFIENGTELSFNEEFIGELKKLPDASYSKPGIDLPRFYKIHEASPATSTFIIKDDTKPIVWVNEPLDLEVLNGKLVYFILRASRSVEFPGEASPHNLLRVDIELIDINNHPPKFPIDIVKVAIIIDQVDNKIKEVPAHDPDDGSILSYSILWDTYKANGNNLPTAKDKRFSISDTGVLSKQVKVTDSMSGSIQFNIAVSDGKYSDTIEVTLYVISNKHLVSFQFKNTKQEIDVKQLDIIEVLKQNFNVEEVGIQHFEIVQNDEATKIARSEETTEVTEVTVFFIKDNAGIDKEEILKRLGDMQFSQKLLNAFIAKALNYRGIITDAKVESLEETYKIALISVSVLAGALIIGLISFFTWKIRSQSNRLDRLEHAEARRPTAMLANIPGANRRATEFINPNFKHEQHDDVISNNLSLTSSARSSINKKHRDDDDDEDFIGVENNDIFKTNANNKDMQF